MSSRLYTTHTRSVRGRERRGPLVHAHAHQPLLLGAIPVLARGKQRQHAVHDARRGPPEVRAVTLHGLPIPRHRRRPERARGREHRGTLVDAHVHELLRALAVLGGLLEGVHGVHGVAAVAE